MQLFLGFHVQNNYRLFKVPSFMGTHDGSKWFMDLLMARIDADVMMAEFLAQTTSSAASWCFEAFQLG